MADLRRHGFNLNWKNQMRKSLMVSVAVAALLATTGLATAQGANQGAAKESPAAASPKGDTAAPMNAPAAKGAETASPGAGPKDVAPQHAQGKPDAKTTGDMKADGKSKASESITPTTTSKDVKNPTAETKSPSDGKAASEMKADSKTKSSESTATSKVLKTPTAETRPSTPDSRTTGNAATSATAAPPAEKRTQITSAIKQEKVEEATNVNFNLSVGTAVPAGVRYYPMPSRIVEIYPEWRGYDFILVHGKYIILRPRTHEIVYIIEG
ncbi:outer membrane biosynthesis protein TonB [Bradyrhizobium diazoefficiens]